MKLRLSSLAAAAVVLFACVLVTRQPATRSHDRESRASSSSAAGRDRVEARIAKKSKAAARSADSSTKPAAADLSHRFDEIHASTADLDRKLAEITGTTGAWLQERIDRLEGLGPVERSRRLGAIESEARDLVLAECERLRLDEELSVKLLAGALEPVHAEIQYASMAPDPASRLAMLRLDRERLLRLQQARTVAEAHEQAWKLAELNSWYQDGLEAILGNQASADAASELP